MNLKFDKDAKETRIKNAYQEASDEIEVSMKNGVDVIELYIDKDVASDVRSMIEAEIKKQGMENHFTFCIVDRRPNSITGRMQSFTGMTVGDQRFYKLKYIK